MIDLTQDNIDSIRCGLENIEFSLVGGFLDENLSSHISQLIQIAKEDDDRDYIVMSTYTAAKVSDRLKDLYAENSKLKEEIEAVGTASYMYARHDQACENAKLRKLARVMAYCNQRERECDGCVINGGDGIVNSPAGCDSLRELMRELGIEVDV